MNNEKFVTRLNTLFKETKRQNKELCVDLIVTPQTVSRWRHGVVVPEMGTMKLIANFFNVRYEWLIGDVAVFGTICRYGEAIGKS